MSPSTKIASPARFPTRPETGRKGRDKSKPPLGNLDLTPGRAYVPAMAIRRILTIDNAADLAQDTFVRLLQRREQLQLNAPRAFLRTVARGLVIDHWRREEPVPFTHWPLPT